MSDALENKAVEIITQLQHLAPQATNAALGAARVDALSSGVDDAIALLLSLAILVFWRRVYWPWAKGNKSYDEFAQFLAGAALVIIGCGCFLIGVFGLVDPWLYTAYFHPELWLAHKVIG